MTVPDIYYTIPLTKVDTTYTSTVNIGGTCQITYSLLNYAENPLTGSFLTLDSTNKIISAEANAASAYASGTYTFYLQAYSGTNGLLK